MTKSDGTTLSSGNEISQSVPVSPEKANLLELWKRSEFLKFQDYLGQLEAERTMQLKDDLQRIKKIERRLKMKLTELENKERDLLGQETELKRSRDDIANKMRRQVEEHQSAIKLLTEQHSVALRFEKEKLKSEEARRRAIELEMASSIHSKKASAKEKKIVVNHQPTDHQLQERVRDLETELKLKAIALEQAQQREALLVKSRDHFRSAVLRMTTVAPGNDQSVIIRLQQTRAELVSSGLYSEDADVIRQLDLKILKAVKSVCGN